MNTHTTHSEVEAAIKQMVAQHKPLSVRNIQSFLGKGSLDLISRILRKHRENTTNEIIQLPGLSEEESKVLAVIGQEFFNSARAKAMKEVEATYTDKIKELEEKISELSGIVDFQREEIAVNEIKHQGSMAILTDKINDLNNKAELTTIKNNALEESLSHKQQEIDAAQQAADSAMDSLNTTKSELDSIKADNSLLKEHLAGCSSKVQVQESLIASKDEIIQQLKSEINSLKSNNIRSLNSMKETIKLNHKLTVISRKKVA